LGLVGLYGLGGLVINDAYNLAKQANTALMRQLGQKNERASAFRVGTIVFSCLIVAGVTSIVFDGQPFLEFILGEKANGPIVATILALLGAGALVLSTYEVAGAMVMLGSRTAWSCAKPIMTGAIVNVVISVSLSPFVPLYGIWAVAGSTLVGNCVAAILMWRESRRLLEWNARDLITVFVPIGATALVSGLAGWALRPFAFSHTLASLGSCILVTALGVGVMVLFSKKMWSANNGGQA
ncbi:MAG: polysaccharide biosynthesis C-terminal domain-containing protein, partial [Myxococcales bacterium]|nr:polysaccharide biosynthesis C-terminal domain-containing protein [Myxococcales bacterium]